MLSLTQGDVKSQDGIQVSGPGPWPALRKDTKGPIAGEAQRIGVVK